MLFTSVSYLSCFPHSEGYSRQTTISFKFKKTQIPGLNFFIDLIIRLQRVVRRLRKINRKIIPSRSDPYGIGMTMAGENY